MFENVYLMMATISRDRLRSFTWEYTYKKEED